MRSEYSRSTLWTLADDRRANQEMQSTLKSLKTRHEKGLLTPAEEVRG